VSDSIVAVDAMGGDHAPAAVVAGAVQAVKRRGLKVALTGPADLLRQELDAAGGAGLGIVIVDAPQAVGMDESPLTAHRRKPGSSVRVAAALVARGDAAALFSAGHTGATFLASRAAFGLAKGVDRPALAVTVPTRAGAAILLDAGANLECEPAHLCQFAIMGAAYARLALQIEHPKVGLLSIGEEAGKGNDLIREAHALLMRAPIEFLGNLEAREFFSGRADVIVCDGFTGNIALKVGEGLVELAQEMVREELGGELLSQIGGLFTRRAFARFRQRVDYAERGGAPLLGLDRLVVIGHGRSSPQAIESGIAMAARLAEQQIVERLTETLHEGQRAEGKGQK
jgi:glycerol-3-phosphate acyltransferase PlsX